MKYYLLIMIIFLSYVDGLTQFTGIGTTTPYSRLNVNGTSWFQGNNTPLSPAANAGIGIGYTTGATGGYIFAFNYATFSPKDLWLNSTGGRVLINSESASPQGRLDVLGGGMRAVYASTNTNEAVYAYSTGGYGLYAYSNVALAVYAVSQKAGGGSLIAAGDYVGMQGQATGGSTDRQAVRGELTMNTGGYAGIFVNGTTGVFGTLTKTAGAFLIDHPTEPDTKFLYHSFVESPDMKNIYDGVTTTNGSGLATITMPSWFQALNMDYRYQLTCIGQFAQAIVQQEMAGNQFVIKTDKPYVKVSWQVTGTRNDPWARDHRIPLEKAKAANEAGKYIYPQGYGKTNDQLLDILKPSNLVNTAAAAASQK